METWRADITNLQQIAELDSSCYPQNPLSVETAAKLLQNPRIVTIAVGDRNSPVAYLVIGSNSKENIIYRLGVGSESRRSHLATELLGSICDNRNIICKLKETNTEGIKFLVANDFKAIAVKRNAFGDCDGILFLKQPN